MYSKFPDQRVLSLLLRSLQHRPHPRPKIRLIQVLQCHHHRCPEARKEKRIAVSELERQQLKRSMTRNKGRLGATAGNPPITTDNKTAAEAKNTIWHDPSDNWNFIYGQMVSASILKNSTIRHWPTAGPSCRGYGDPEVVYPSPITMAASNRRNSSKLVLRGIIHAETVYLIQLNTLIIDRHRRNEGEGSFWEVEEKQHG